jgi:hypothetical protein
VLDDRPTSVTAGSSSSLWIALSRDPRPLAVLNKVDGGWQALAPYRGFTLWIDDYASILPLLKNDDPF